MKRMITSIFLGLALGALGFSAFAHSVHGGSPVEMLWTVKFQLNLNTAQQQQWANAAALSASARKAMHASMQQARAALEAELAKAEPDLASVAAAADSARDQVSSLHRQARDAWLAVYATFTPEQKGIARDAIKSKLAAIEAKRASRQQSPPSSN